MELMYRTKYAIWPILLNVLAVSIFAQINIRSIDSYSIKDGLSQTSVHTIFKDSRGLLWLGTEGGLNKYDGYEITPYHSLQSQNILSSRGTIYNILEDGNGDIWYGSAGIVSRLSIHSESIENLEAVLKNNFNLEFGVVLNLYLDSKGNIWFGTFGQGFFKISADFTDFKNYRNDPELTGDSSLDYVRDFYEDNSGSIWIATYGGLVKFNPSTEEMKNIFYQEDLIGYKHTTIYKIIPIDLDKLMLFTKTNGILLYDLSVNEVSKYDEEINNTLKNATLRDASIDREGRIWTSAFGKGVFVIDPKKQTVRNVANIVDQAYKQALSEPLSILADQNGIIWVGTQHNGLLKLTLGKRNIHTINNSTDGFESIDNNVTNSVAKDQNGIIWQATNSGLFKINPIEKSVERLSISNRFSSLVFKIYNILFTDDYAWLSLGAYIVRYDLNKDEYKMIEIEEGGTITEINILNDDQFILGSTSGNIYIYNRSTDERINIPVTSKSTFSNSVIDCYLDNNENLWVGTNNGLFLVDLKKDSLYAKKKELNLRLDFITSITSFDDKKLWFGTYGDGLFCFDKNTAQLNHFTYQDGLPDNTVYGIMYDSNNKLWMSSNRGVFEFNPTNNMVRTLDVADGLQGFEYNSKSYSKSSDGTLFYGGVNGFSYFSPAEIERNDVPPSILIDNVILYDSVIVTNISKDFNDIYEFSYNENSISFEFTALDFMNPPKNTYEYMLEGVNKNWIKAGRKRYATFPNMSPGEYKFIVRGTNSDQVYNKEGVSFSFVIYPPFWATWWFRTLLVSLTLLIIYSIYKVRMINQEKRLREIEGIRRKIADDFHDDLGHKLTRISLYSELIKNQEEFGTNKNLYLNKISEAANSLFYETKDFIWSIDPGNDTVYDVLVYIKDFGDDFFNRSGIAFKVDEIKTELKKYTLPMKSKREIVLIFKEAMNNVIKHSNANIAELKAEVSDLMLNISLYDDGEGFNVEANGTKGRGLASIRKRAELIGSKIKIESDDNGTCVSLSLKTKEA